jgi:glycerophosphoryl diester phosphodiesterase
MKKFLIGVPVLILFVLYWMFKGMVQQPFIDIEKPNMNNLRKVELVAHRGASGYAPENSIAAFQLALDYKADIIELDVHQSKDGEAIVIHDATLERTTNGTGSVVDFPTSELIQLDNGTWFNPEFSNERIPTLDSAIKLINGQCILLIEIKRGKEEIYEGLGKRVVDLIHANRANSWCIVQAFDSDYIREVNGYDPSVNTQKLIVSDLDLFPAYTDYKFQWGWIASGLDITALNSYHKLLTRSQVESRHKNGWKTYIYTVNDPSIMKKMINMGVDGIITDYPDRLIELKRTWR